jgi:hypothetical protein
MIDEINDTFGGIIIGRGNQNPWINLGLLIFISILNPT